VVAVRFEKDLRDISYQISVIRKRRMDSSGMGVIVAKCPA